MNSVQFSNINNFDQFDVEYLNKCFSGIDFDHLKSADINKVNNHLDKKQLDKVDTCCVECGGTNMVDDYSSGIRVCKNCGQVADIILDQTSEWRNYDDDGGKCASRCSSVNPLLVQSSLGTVIGGRGHHRLKTLQTWNAMPAHERSLNNMFTLIKTICTQNNLLKCIEDDAKIMYKIVYDTRHEGNNKEGKRVITRGLSRKGIVAACIYFACKRNGDARKLTDVASMFNISTKKINAGCVRFMKCMTRKNSDFDSGNSDPVHYVKYHCNDLKIKKAYAEHAMSICRNIQKLNIMTEHNPYSLAAVSVFILAEHYQLCSITKKKIALSFGISEVTITKTYKTIETYRDIVVDNELTDKVAQEKKQDEEDVDYALNPEILARMKKFGIVMSDGVPRSEKNDDNEDDENNSNDNYDTDSTNSTNSTNDNSNCSYDVDEFDIVRKINLMILGMKDIKISEHSKCLAYITNNNNEIIDVGRRQLTRYMELVHQMKCV
jgi:transcription initiation factor TFIIB